MPPKMVQNKWHRSEDWSGHTLVLSSLQKFASDNSTVLLRRLENSDLVRVGVIMVGQQIIQYQKRKKVS